MEDTFCVAYQKKSDKKIQDDVCHEGLDRIDNVSSEGTGPERGNCFKQVKQDLEYVFAGIYDGHGGNQAAEYTRDNLLVSIIFKLIWTSILKAVSAWIVENCYRADMAGITLPFLTDQHYKPERFLVIR